ncbi:MAG: hypothetical protein JNK07_10240 [Alphaproteobacteria bacterium]|nr:hypothetical protein [Alphaproteobacteria bacterium]
MRSTLILLATGIGLAACSVLPFGEEETDRPTATTPAATTLAAAAPEAQRYEIKDADRGLVRRVKVLLNGRTVDTLTLSRGRTQPSAYCCTADGCQEIETAKACTTFKMICNTEGACERHTTVSGSGKL